MKQEFKGVNKTIEVYNVMQKKYALYKQKSCGEFNKILKWTTLNKILLFILKKMKYFVNYLGRTPFYFLCI